MNRPGFEGVLGLFFISYAMEMENKPGYSISAGYSAAALRNPTAAAASTTQIYLYLSS